MALLSHLRLHTEPDVDNVADAWLINGKRSIDRSTELQPCPLLHRKSPAAPTNCGRKRQRSVCEVTARHTHASAASGIQQTPCVQSISLLGTWRRRLINARLLLVLTWCTKRWLPAVARLIADSREHRLSWQQTWHPSQCMGAWHASSQQVHVRSYGCGLADNLANHCHHCACLVSRIMFCFSLRQQCGCQ